MIGGISNGGDMNAFQSVIDQVRASDTGYRAYNRDYVVDEGVES